MRKLEDFYQIVDKLSDKFKLNDIEKKRFTYQLYFFYTNNIDIDDVQGNTLWNHPTFKHVRQSQKELDDLIENPIEVMEGIFTCFKCKSKRVFSKEKQTRSCDENSTTFYSCIACGNKWKI